MTSRLRSYIMSRIRGKNTSPEKKMLRILQNSPWAFSFVFQPKMVRGRPDFVIPDTNTAIFVDGCFWHGCKRHFKMPKTNKRFWRAKISRNIQRRIEVKRMLRADGWKVLEIWEHALK